MGCGGGGFNRAAATARLGDSPDRSARRLGFSCAPSIEPHRLQPRCFSQGFRNMAAKKSGKPNILVIWGDDIGQSNLSCYTHGLMGYHTPNIDRIADEGMLFTDYYAEQSCTAGRASFITGQAGLRTGLTKVGLPGADLGMRKEDPTIARALKEEGYATGQFGKNHLGDKDEHLPTMHGFDEFFGNLYHLNAEEEPENRDYPDPKEFPNFKKNFGPRGVLHCWADGKGGQKIENTGPLTKKRMETVDEEFLAAAQTFIKKQVKDDTPFFVWFNTTHMHAYTHAKKESYKQAGRWQSEYHDVMVDHDKHVGALLDYDRVLFHRQWPAHEHVAGRRHDAVPQRKEYLLGRRLPCPRAGALAGQDRSRLGVQRDRRPPRLVPNARGGCRQHHRGGGFEKGPHLAGQPLQGAPRRLQHPAAAHGQGRQESARRLHLFQ
jgi:hypothetical protein